MASEVLAREYFYAPQELDDAPLWRGIEEHFTHFALHDIESVCWTGLWMVFFRHMPDHVEDDARKKKRQEMTVSVFPGTNAFFSRLVIADNNDFCIRMIKKWLPKPFEGYFQHLLQCFEKLKLVYIETEATFLRGISCLSANVIRSSPQPAFPGAGKDVKIHSEVMTCIREMVNDCQQIMLEPLKAAI